MSVGRIWDAKVGHLIMHALQSLDFSTNSQFAFQSALIVIDKRN